MIRATRASQKEQACFLQSFCQTGITLSPSKAVHFRVQRENDAWPATNEVQSRSLRKSVMKKHCEEGKILREQDEAFRARTYS